MNTTPKTSRRMQVRASDKIAPFAPATGVEMMQQHFDALGDPQAIVEHMTVPGFMRLIDHRWHLHDIRRFGDMVGNMAEAMHISYIPAADRSLGILRMFPEPLLRRVYDTLAPQCGWPLIVDVETPQLEDAKKKRDTIKAHERTLKQLNEMISDTDDLGEVETLRASVRVLEAKIGNLRVQTGEPVATSV